MEIYLLFSIINNNKKGSEFMSKKKKDKELDESINKLKPTFDNEFLKLYKWDSENNSQEINLMFGMIALLKEKGEGWVELDYGLVKLLSGRNINDNPKRTEEFLKPALENISSAVPIKRINEDGQRVATIVSLFVSEINYDEKTVKIRVVEDELGQMMFNHLEFSRGFTKLNYNHLHNINSAAGKKLYLLLSRYVNQGVMNFPIEDIRTALETEKTKKYSDKIFISKVINPAIEDIESYSKPDFSFTCKKIFDRNNKVTNLIFSMQRNNIKKVEYVEKKENQKLEDENYMKIRDEKIKNKEKIKENEKRIKIDELELKEKERNNNTGYYINYTEDEKNEIFKSSY